MTRKTMAIDALRVPTLAMLLFVGGALFAGSAHAQTDDLPDPGMLPDHPLYFVTSMSEDVGTFFTFGEANKAERALELSEERLAEARALASDKPEEARRAAERYQEQLDRALSNAEEARAKGEDPDSEALSNISEATPRHLAVLAEIHQKVPEQARPGIERAMQASKRGHSRARRAMVAPPGGRPDSPGRGPPRDRDRSDSAEAGRPDDADRGPPRDPSRPDSVETGRPGDVDRGPPPDRGGLPIP